MRTTRNFINPKWGSEIGYFLFRNAALLFVILFFAFMFSLAMWLETNYGFFSSIFR